MWRVLTAKRPRGCTASKLSVGLVLERGRDRLVGQLGIDVLGQVSDTAGNNAVYCDAEANDGCGQNDPVNSYCTGFVIAESVCKLEKFHCSNPSWVLILFALVRLAQVFASRCGHPVRLGMQTNCSLIGARIGHVLDNFRERSGAIRGSTSLVEDAKPRWAEQCGS